jgi:hypothetical protein
MEALHTQASKTRTEHAVMGESEVAVLPERTDKPLLPDTRLYCCVPFGAYYLWVGGCGLVG